MRGLPKIVLERLKGIPISNQCNRQSAIENRQFLQGFEHPDANLLTAFVEKTLTEGERTQVLNHLAQCAECREIATITLPAKVEAPEPTRSPVRPGWSVRPALRWGALAAALGAVVIVVVLHSHSRRRQETASKDMRSTVVASASKAALQPPAEIPGHTSLKSAAATAGAESCESPREMAKLEKRAVPPRNLEIATRPAGAELKRRVTLMAAARPPAAGTVPAKAQSVEVSAGLNANLVGGVSAPGSSLPHPLVPSSETKELMGGAAAASVRARSQQARLPSMAFRGELENAVAQPAALWTISPDGKLQRSDDGGKTWEEVRVDDKVTFRVIWAVGRDVWAGGSGGALYHSSNGGATWTRVDLSSGGSPTTETIVSIISASADLQRITVRTEAGEEWTTEDGGRHWRAVTSDE